MKTIHLIQPTTARLFVTASMLGALTFTACQRRPVTEETKPPMPSAKTTTFETGRLGAAIDAFAQAPTAENQSSVNLALAKLDNEIAELETLSLRANGSDRADATAKLGNLKTYRAEEMARFVKLQVGTASDASSPADSRSASQKLEDTAEKVGDKIEGNVRKVGESIENAAEKTGETIRDATH